MVPNLRGTTAILTSGSRGLGGYIGRALARNGVNIALAARSTKELEAVASGLSRCGIKAVPITLDGTDEAGRANLLRQTEASLGPVDILIKNAAVEGVGRFTGKTSPEIEQIIATNLTAPVLLTHLALPGMIERQRGHIINIASLAGNMGNPFAAVYGATKAGLMAWSAGLRLELEGIGVSISVVSPGFVSEVGNVCSTRGHWLLGRTKPEDVARGGLARLIT